MRPTTGTRLAKTVRDPGEREIGGEPTADVNRGKRGQDNLRKHR